MTFALESWPNTDRLNVGVLIGYRAALEELTEAQLLAAILRLLKHTKFFPSAHEILECARDEAASGSPAPLPAGLFHAVLRRPERLSLPTAKAEQLTLEAAQGGPRCTLQEAIDQNPRIGQLVDRLATKFRAPA